MKKIVSILLIIALVLSVSACGSKSTGDAKTPANAFIAAFADTVKAGNYSSTVELGEAIAAASAVPLDLGVMAVEPGYLNGFSSEIEGFSEGAMIGPWIGSIPFIAYVFVPADGVSTDELIATLKDKADLSWNICTHADEMAYAAENGFVCFVMAPASFED